MMFFSLITAKYRIFGLLARKVARYKARGGLGTEPARPCYGPDCGVDDVGDGDAILPAEAGDWAGWGAEAVGGAERGLMEPDPESEIQPETVEEISETVEEKKV